MPKPSSENGWICKILLMPFTHLPYLRDQRLKISVSTTVVFDGRISETTEIEFAVPREAAVETDFIPLLFNCPNNVSPFILGSGPDTRFLAFAIFSLELTALTPTVYRKVEEVTLSQQTIKFGGIEELSYIETTDISKFGLAKEHERLRVFAALSGPNQNRLFRESTFSSEFVAEHYRYRQPPDVNVYALKEHVLWGNGLLTKSGKFFLQSDCLPTYLNGYVTSDAHTFPEYWVGPIDRGDVTTIDVAGPVGVVIHPNIVYGHFLLEILPKLYLLGLLREFGATFKVALSDRTPSWVHEFVSLYVEERDVIHYDMTNSSVRASAFLVPSMMHTDHNLHPAFNLMVTDVLRCASIPALPARKPGRDRKQNRIYLSRRKVSDAWHNLLNEEEVEQTMQALGFTVIHPQTLPIREQLAIYAEADVIAGQYSSALHNAMFSPIGAVVISLNCINWYQSVIARLRGHKLAFVKPSDGVFRTWRSRGSGTSDFSIDPATLREIVLSVVGESDGLVRTAVKHYS